MARSTETFRQKTVSGSLSHLISIALILGLLSYCANWFDYSSWGYGSISILWPPTGFLLGVLLCKPRRQWPEYIAVGFGVDLLINLAPPSHASFLSAISLAGCNVTEVSVAAFLLYRTIQPKPDLSRPRQLISLLVYGVILAPALASFFASMCFTGVFKGPTLHAFAAWYTSDALGIAIMTPLYLSLRKRPLFLKRTWFEVGSLFFLLGALSVLIFWQTSLPLLFVIFPILLLLEVRLGLAGSAMGLLAVSVIGGWYTSHGYGPIALTHFISRTSHILILQFFIAVCMMVLYIVETVLVERRRFEVSLVASEARFRLLAEECHDIIVLKSLDQRCQYVSPAMKKLLGWEPGEFLQKKFDQTVHPEDLADMQKLFVECYSGSTFNTLVYRSKKKDGSYLWTEANLVLHRDPETNAPAGFINVIRDVSGRKAVEDKLSNALDVAKSQASTDALTGVANRGSFDKFIQVEWRRGIRTRTSLSVLLIDIDHFKQYNDMYGHVAGDNCLKEIAGRLGSVVHRSSDLLARYGGEEFVVVLPNTNSKGAQLIAEQIRKAAEALQIVHEGNSHGIVTLSIGCATQIPQLGSSCTLLVETADDALYEAKSAGRNSVRLAASQA